MVEASEYVCFTSAIIICCRGIDQSRPRIQNVLGLLATGLFSSLSCCFMFRSNSLYLCR